MTSTSHCLATLSLMHGIDIAMMPYYSLRAADAKGDYSLDKKEASSAVLTLEKILGQKIRARQKDLAHWRMQREEAAQKEEECLKSIAEMEMAIAVFRRALGLASEAPPTDELDVLRYRSQTVAQSCLDIMRSTGGRAKVTDMTRVLVRAGKLRNYRTGYATVTKTLDRDQRSVKIGRGEYAISRAGEL